MGHRSYFTDKPITFISIHPSRVGWDLHSRKHERAAGHFNPPIPCGMGLAQIAELTERYNISIHPSRVGWDPKRRCGQGAQRHFNPPIPCGMGLNTIALSVLGLEISIHPSRVGWDFLRFPAQECMG